MIYIIYISISVYLYYLSSVCLSVIYHLSIIFLFAPRYKLKSDTSYDFTKKSLSVTVIGLKTTLKILNSAVVLIAGPIQHVDSLKVC